MGVAKTIVMKVTNRMKKRGFEFNRFYGYEEASAFLKSPEGKWVYISADDSRGNNLLIRSAENDKDYRGGQNHFVQVDSTRNEFNKAMALIKRLSERG